MNYTSMLRRFHPITRTFRRTALTVGIAGFFSLGSAAYAVPIFGDGALGDFSGDLSYSASSSTQGSLTLSLTNTSPTDNGGFITAFLLNNPDDLISGISSTSFTDADFGLLGLTDNGLNGSPNGLFDFGAALGNSYQGSGPGGGAPSDGIAAGNSAVFTFTLTGTMLDTLSAQSFIDELSDGSRGAGQGTEWLVVRFRGFEDGGSDKVPGEPGDSTPVPEPAGVLLFALGLLGIGGSRWFFRRR